VFDAVLGGAGRSGIIVGASLRLRPFKPRVRRFCLLYDALGPWLDDQRSLIASRSADYLECFCTPSIQGFRREGNRGRPFAQWFFALHVSFEYDDVAPSPAAALANLSPSRLVWSDDMDTVDYLDRYEPRFAGMRRSGATLHQHPWVEALVPGAAMTDLLPRVLDAVPLALGEAVRVFFVATRNPRPFFMTPASDEVVGVAFTPIQVPPHLQDDAVAAAHAIDELTRAAGAKRYVSGYLGAINPGYWRDHFGERYEAWIAAKHEMDPNNVLVSTLFPASAGPA
jgi:FAD/FMN-containing dehydrogenase